MNITFSKKKLGDLRTALLDWHCDNGRHQIPWKLKKDGTSPVNGEVLNPYGIFVAEVMLQQTQFKVVLPYWTRWMSCFPTLDHLANAEHQQVLLLWQGLGYYSRARRLHLSSSLLLKRIGSSNSLNSLAWPRDLKSWMDLPGIGRSTAGSIISAAFDLPEPVLDGNVKRVLARLLAISKPPMHCIQDLWDFSEQLLDQQNSRRFNQALMDLGSQVCTPSNPNCEKCPWKSFCIAYSSRQQTNIPVKSLRKKNPLQIIGVGIVLNQQGNVLIDQRLDEGLLGGMWEFPGGKKESEEDIQQTIRRELKEELGIEVKVLQLLISFDHAYSHRKLRFFVYVCEWISGEPKPLQSQQVRWVSPSDLISYPFPAANAKMISAFLEFLNDGKSN